MNTEKKFQSRTSIIPKIIFNISPHPNTRSLIIQYINIGMMINHMPSQKLPLLRARTMITHILRPRLTPRAHILRPRLTPRVHIRRAHTGDLIIYFCTYICPRQLINLEHYHLQVQAKSKKIVQKTQCYI